MEAHLDGAFRDTQCGSGFAHIHLFDVAKQHDVTVNLRQALDGLARSSSLTSLRSRVSWGISRQLVSRAGVKSPESVFGYGVQGFFAAALSAAQAAQALIARNRQDPGTELGLAAIKMQIAENLDSRLLSGIFGFGLITQE